MAQAEGKIFGSQEERDQFIDANFPDRMAAGDGTMPGLYELGDDGYLSVVSLTIKWRRGPSA